MNFSAVIQPKSSVNMILHRIKYLGTIDSGRVLQKAKGKKAPARLRSACS